jgi:hypothetical protein
MVLTSLVATLATAAFGIYHFKWSLRILPRPACAETT